MATRFPYLVLSLLSLLIMMAPLWIESTYPSFATYVYEHDLAPKVMLISMCLVLYMWAAFFFWSKIKRARQM